MKVSNLYELTENQIMNIIAKELYYKSIITTSKSKITTYEFLNIKNIIEGKEYEIISCKFNSSRRITLVDKSEYDKINDYEKREKLKNIYSRLKNGWEGCKDNFDDISEKTLKRLFDHEIKEVFDYIYIEKVQQEYEEKEKKESEYQCQLCKENITEEEIENNECIFDEKEYYKTTYHYHKYCYHFAFCNDCRTKDNLRYAEHLSSFYCEECYVLNERHLNPWEQHGNACFRKNSSEDSSNSWDSDNTSTSSISDDSDDD